MGRVEIGGAQQPDLALLLRLHQALGQQIKPGNRIVPPMELHQVELFHAKPSHRAVNDGVHMLCAQFTQRKFVRNQLGVDLDGVGVCQAAAKPAQQAFHAGIDVRAIEGGKSELQLFSSTGA